MGIVGRTVTKGILAALLALMLPLSSWAAGLGRLTVHSPLGQPLDAEIEIVSLQPGEEEGLTARLPSNEAFRRAGIELNPALLGLRFALERRDGRPVVRLSTSQPVNEPFLDLLVELQWNTGRLVREYTFLLDPPNYRGTAIATVPAPVQSQPVETRVQAEARPLEVRPVESPAAPAAPAALATYEVKRGDTLFSIARTHLPAGVTLEQMVAALYNANRQAFIDDNMNLMRSGEVLNIPGAESADILSNRQAAVLVQAHSASFSEYRSRLARAPAAVESARGEREATGRIEPKPEALPAATAQDELRLAKAEPGRPAGGTVGAAARGDDLVARERELQEAQSRVAELEKNVADLQKLLELRNQQLAELELRAKAIVVAAPAVPAAVEKPAATPPAVESKSTPPRATAPLAQEPSLIDELLENQLALGGFALVLLLIGYGAVRWRRSKAEQARFQDSVLGAASAPAAAAVTPPVAPPSSSSQSPVSGMEPEEVDPIAEADVYMAYGRDSQAEEILKEALQKDPNRAAIHSKLLEIYANRRDKAAFEQSALKLKSLTNGAGPDWEKAATLGRSIDAQSGLFGAAGKSVPRTGAPAAAAAPAAVPSLDFDLGSGTTQEAALPDSALEAARERTAPAIDFDLGTITGETAQEKPDFTPEGTLIMGPERSSQSAFAALDFDLDLSSPDEKKSGGRSGPLRAPEERGAPVDFDLSLDLGASGEASLQDAVPAAPLDLSSIDLDLSEPHGSPGAGGGDPKRQEVATKLDLAKAYEEMGDKDGARELLAEVVREGDTGQKGEAEQMLAKLG
jgi:pilus assembly protein FimV